MSPEVFSNDPIPSLNPLSPRQVTFENHDTEHDLSTHMEMESMATLTETAGGECTPEQVSQFLRSNPSYLTKHVISEVNLDVVQSWLMQLCASGRRRSETEAIPANSTVNHATKRKHSKPLTSEFLEMRNSSVTGNGRAPLSGTATTSASSTWRSSSHRRFSLGTERDSPKNDDSGATTPTRKISAHDFNNGELDELPLIDHSSGSFITGELRRLNIDRIWEQIPDQVDCSDEEMYSKLSKQQAIASNMGVIDQELLLAELVKDIANELDNRLLCHKILQHLCALINADRALLYLVEGDKKSDRNYLVNALYDVTRGVDNGVSNEEDVESKSGRYLRVPIGVGVIGTVAKCRELINIQDVNEDERFLRGTDDGLLPPSYAVNNMLCVPVLNVSQEVIGVAQVINKQRKPQNMTTSLDVTKELRTNGCEPPTEAFNARDARLCRTYLAFCGICLMNAKLYNRSRLESKRSKVLLEMAKCVFEEQSTVEVLVTRIMRQLLSFMQCERCSVAIFPSNVTPAPSDANPLTNTSSNYTAQGNLTAKPNDIGNRALEQSLLSRSKTFHMSFSDLDQFGELIEEDSNYTTSPFPPQSRKATSFSPVPSSTSFPLYHNILYQCMNTSSPESMVNLSSPMEDPSVEPYWTSSENGDDSSSSASRPSSVLCSGIRNSKGELIGCVQLVNKPEGGFTKTDEHFVEAFVIFCGLGISNTRTYEDSVELSNKQKVSMEMLSYYTKASDAEVKSVLSHAYHSAASSGSSRSRMNLTNRVGDVENNSFDFRSNPSQSATSTNRSSFAFVPRQDSSPASSQVELDDNSQDRDRAQSLSEITAKSQPQSNKQSLKTISSGVNNSKKKTSQPIPITESQEEKALVKSRKISAPPHPRKLRHSVAEVCDEEEDGDTNWVCSDCALSGGGEWRKKTLVRHIYNFKLDELKLSEVDTLSYALAMFRELDLIRVLKTDEKTMVKWLVTTKKNYRQVTYHNWRHAFSVCQLMFACLTTGNLCPHFSPLQKAALLLATISHDLDHRGTNNSFQKLTESPLAQLYSTSTLEHHHFDRFQAILLESSCDILANLRSEEQQAVVSSVKHAIISTDLALYFQKRDAFFQLVEDGSFDISDSAHHALLCSMLMTASDLGAITRPWHVEFQIANMIAEEFFEQGDIERQKYNKELNPMFDRSKQSEIPQLQLNFIDKICGPVYKNLALLFPSLKPLLEGLENNRRHWSDLAEEAEAQATSETDAADEKNSSC
ncbi:cGMP-specific 3',5'-cyclic phosphodiesterase-like isoform X3 [Symsagittifera roscoffensis]